MEESEILSAVRARYREVAASAEGRFPYPVGRASALGLGYEPAWLEGAPAGVVERFVGVGNPFLVRRPRAGERVLDLGCGAGLDLHVASRLSGAPAVGVDLCPELVRLAPRGALLARMDFLPFGDGSFDLAVANGSLNLAPRKERLFREVRRVLRPGGALAAADLLVVDSVPAETLRDMDAWST